MVPQVYWREQKKALFSSLRPQTLIFERNPDIFLRESPSPMASALRVNVRGSSSNALPVPSMRRSHVGPEGRTVHLRSSGFPNLRTFRCFAIKRLQTKRRQFSKPASLFRSFLSSPFYSVSLEVGSTQRKDCIIFSRIFSIRVLTNRRLRCKLYAIYKLQ